MAFSISLLYIVFFVHFSEQAVIQKEIPQINEADILSSIRTIDLKKLISYMGNGTLLKYLEERFQNDTWKIYNPLADKLRIIEVLTKGDIISVPTKEYVKQNPNDGALFNYTLIPGMESTVTYLINPRSMHNDSALPLGFTAFHIICLLDGVEPTTAKYVLDQYGGDINLKSPENITALFVAVHAVNLPLIRFLVENGATVDEVFHAARPLRNLVESDSAFMKLFSKKTVKNPFESMRLKVTPMFLAAIEHHTEVVRYLLEKGANPNAEGEGWIALFPSVLYPDLLELLLEHGSNISARDIGLGQTIVHKAASYGQVDILELLLKYHANLNVTDDYGWTPLHVAVYYQLNDLKSTVEFLLDRGSNVNALTDGGYSVLGLLEAGANRSFVSYLVDNFPRNDTTELAPVEASPERADVLRLLLSRGADINHKDDILGWTPLHWAAAIGDLASIEILIDRGADLGARAKIGYTPSEIAEHFGMKKALEYFTKNRKL